MSKTEWKEVRLGDFVQFQNGFAFKSSDFKEFGDYKVVKIKELKDGLVKFFDDTASVSATNISEKYVLKKGDVIFALTGDPVSKPNPSSWVGRVSIYNKSIPAVLNQRTCKAICSNKIDSTFLYYHFRLWENFYLLASKATGSASQANISTNTIADTLISLPPLAEQQRIAKILSSLDDKIELNNAINRNLEEQAQIVFKSYEMERHFKEMKISDVADINPDSYGTKDNWNFVNYLDTSNITQNVISELQYIDLKEESLPSRAKRKVVLNDIIYSTVRPNQLHYGIIDDLKTNMLVSTGFAVIRTNNTFVSNEYIYLNLTQKDTVEKLQQIAEQSVSTFPAIKPSDIGNCLIKVFEKNDAQILNNQLSAIFGKILQNNRENKSLANIRDGLLPKLMTGEIDIAKTKS